MANTDGGVLIFGIGESAGRASSLHPLGLAGIPERLDLVARSLDEPVTPTEVFTVAEQPGQGYVVLVLPRSDRAPHIRSGRVVGRTSKGNVDLTRRQLGELFARSKGFAQEFNLAVLRTGRLKVTNSREPRPGTIGSIDHYLTCENDGETAIYSCRWQWAGESRPRPKLLNDPFPIATMEPGASFRLRFAVDLGSGPSHEIETLWEDAVGTQFSAR